MSALIIVGLTVKDSEKFNIYGAAVPKTLSSFSGEVIAKGIVEQLYGKFDYEIQVVLKFPTREQATNWYHSGAYQDLVSVRNEAMDSQFQLIG